MFLGEYLHTALASDRIGTLQLRILQSQQSLASHVACGKGQPTIECSEKCQLQTDHDLALFN